MGTVYIDKKDCHIKLDGNTLSFYKNGQKEGFVPLEPVKRVIIIGNLTVDTNVLRRLTDSGVSCLFLSGRSLRFSGMLHGRLHNNGLLRVKQYEKSLSGFAIEYAQKIVKRKVEVQIDFLNELLNCKDELRFYITETIQRLKKTVHRLTNDLFDIDSLKGLEGSASGAYFQVYVKLFPDSLNFKRRTKRPPLDPVNAMLSLCYTLLHFELVREIEVIGLDPTIGFYHQFEYGRESLACDLMEFYRCSVDRFVWHIFKERLFTADDFYRDEKGGYYLKKSKRKEFYPIYEEWAKGMRPHFIEDVRVLARRIADDKDIIPE